MHIRTIVDHVFGRFHNLNLMVLLEDLRRGLAVRGDWSRPQALCPLAHGLADGDTVRLLGYASQAVNLRRACHIAARELGSDPFAVERFVIMWDSAWPNRAWLTEQLERILSERRADADAVQRVLEAPALVETELQAMRASSLLKTKWRECMGIEPT